MLTYVPTEVIFVQNVREFYSVDTTLISNTFPTSFAVK